MTYMERHELKVRASWLADVLNAARGDIAPGADSQHRWSAGATIDKLALDFAEGLPDADREWFLQRAGYDA